jgi:hypothetical protein
LESQKRVTEAIEASQGGEVVRARQHLVLEAAHLAGRSDPIIDGASADDLTHHGIEGQPVGIIDVLAAGQPAECSNWRAGATMLCRRL